MSKYKANEIILVLGGARSGKSSFAQQYVESQYSRYLFMATARAHDDEMVDRVRKHKDARGPDWDLIEEPINVPLALRTKCGDVDVVLIDCMTIWLTNILLEKGEDKVEDYIDELLSVLSEKKNSIIIVSNEVGTGIVPENALARQFRDLAGRLNQRIAAISDKVVFSIAGIPTYIKGSP